jgi:ParB family transcriptional regulator, chromosome partitioning protein
MSVADRNIAFDEPTMRPEMPALQLRQVALDLIEPSPRNPRRRLGAVDELADSLQMHGLLQPIVLRPRSDERFEIVAGHRRFEAAKRLGWTAIPAVVRTTEPDEAYVLTLVENLQRNDLSPKEESAALEVLVRERSWSTRQVAEAVKRSASYVSRRLRVFEDASLAPLVLNGQLSVSAAEELLPLDEARKRSLAEEAVERAWDSVQIRAAIRKGVTQSAPRRQVAIGRRARELRSALLDVQPWELSESDRRDLRLLFRDLAVMAKAPAQKQALVFPPLPAVAPRAAKRRT